jgi:succinate-semialdehyde dehydrogenase/glutarate-semialdehyde dehydrogenase
MWLFIDGAFADGAGTETFDVISPVTGEHVGTIPLPVQADLDAAVAAAHTAQRAWAGVNVWERAAVCRRVADELDKRRDQLARLQTLEQGKPLAESIADVTEAAELFRLHGEDAVRLHGETLPSRDSAKRMFTFHRAVGIWGIITPWNFPLLMFAEFAAPGLATGNALVVKPPTHTPLTVLAAMEALIAAGLPKGLVNILPGDGAFGDALVRHPGVHAIGFIGSSATGAKIQAAAGLKRSIMECSGNGPLVVLADADLDAAAKAAVDGAYPCAGQVCCATERVLVDASVHDAFVGAVLREASASCLATRSTTRRCLGRSTTSRSRPRWTGTWTTPAPAERGSSSAGSAARACRPTCTTSSPSSTRSPPIACCPSRNPSARWCRSSPDAARTTCCASPTTTSSVCRARSSPAACPPPSASSRR